MLNRWYFMPITNAGGVVFVLARVVHREFADGKRFPAEVEKFLLSCVA